MNKNLYNWQRFAVTSKTWTREGDYHIVHIQTGARIHVTSLTFDPQNIGIVAANNKNKHFNAVNIYASGVMLLESCYGFPNSESDACPAQIV